MTKKNLLLATAVTTGALAVFAAGCLGSDAEVNSQIYNPNPDAPVVGVGGTSGAGGGGGSGGPNPNGPIVGVPIATFDTSSQDFAFSMYDDPGDTNLAVKNKGTAPTLQFDADNGSPDNGSLKVVAPYYAANQYVDVQSKAFPSSDLRNWKGGKLHVRFRVDEGSTFSGQVQPYADTTTGYVFVGSALNQAPGAGNNWQEFVVDLDTAITRNSGYDLTKVILFGVHIGSGGMGANQGTATFHIDSFSVEGITAPLPPDAGDDAATSSDAGADTTAAPDAAID